MRCSFCSRLWRFAPGYSVKPADLENEGPAQSSQGPLVCGLSGDHAKDIGFEAFTEIALGCRFNAAGTFPAGLL
jgi:hypothetical protein